MRKECDTESNTLNRRPWWRDAGLEVFCPGVEMEGSKISSWPKHIQAGPESKTNKLFSRSDRDDGTCVMPMEISVVPQSERNSEEVHAPFVVPSRLDGYFSPQFQLVSHSVLGASCPFLTPFDEGDMPAEGSLTKIRQWVHSNFGGCPSRMALPIEIAEEPVYVNAKQYHGILRRRQLRAKAELEKKNIKLKKPYLHESRHLHAMRRERGCGGRFLTTKRLEKSTTNATPDNEGANSSALGLTNFLTSSSSKSMPPKLSEHAKYSTFTSRSKQICCEGEEIALTFTKQ